MGSSARAHATTGYNLKPSLDLSGFDANSAHEAVTVHGVVQGVGFRPFVYRLANDLGIVGTVQNAGEFVVIHAQAAPDALTAFRTRLVSDAPPQARISRVDVAHLTQSEFQGFAIAASEKTGTGALVIPPDIPVCNECTREMLDPHNRRFRYPFISCTNCGPRYTIVLSPPYDRERTTMRRFEMCPDCRREYEDPQDRRFHAEPIACVHCGPHIELCDENGIPQASHDAALTLACEEVRRGRILAVKGIGGFHLIVDARNTDAVRRLRRRKDRAGKPLALMYPSLTAVEANCELNEIESELLSGNVAPIVLCRRKPNPESPWRITNAVAPGNPYLGVMLPYSPLHHLLLRELGFPVVATSGNRSEEPVCYANDQALARLRGIADAFLLHDRPIARFIDDSVVRVVAGRPLILRRARGYVPVAIPLPFAAEDVLALGAQQKNTVAVASGHSAQLSRHVGDLDSREAADAFVETISDLEGISGLAPTHTACDMHPDYFATRFAHRARHDVAEVQHHYAHVLSAMVDNGLQSEVLGIAWDGSGYGTDGTVWGGEFLICDAFGYSRFASLRPFALPGGEKAIQEPKRTAVALLRDAVGPSFWTNDFIPGLQTFKEKERHALDLMLTRQINSPLTSSVGRLFDGVASIIGVRHECDFEGQAAMELEFAAENGGADASYPFSTAQEDCLRIDWRPMVCALVADLRNGIAIGRIAARFHETVVEMAIHVAKQARRNDVVLSGGCFQNALLTEGIIDRLRAEGFRTWWHRQVPPNDGGLALGQIAAVTNKKGVH